MIKKIFRNLKIVFQILFNRIILRKPDFSEKKIFLKGQIYANEIKKKKIIKNFKEVEFSAFSQFGEDGIISWLISKIPNLEKIFIEIGTEDYWESNTRFLLKSMNWKGYLIEGSEKYVKKIKSQRIYWQNNIQAINEFVSKENINKIISNNIKEKNIGLLSIDIDGNDLWILKEIDTISPDIIICEFNTVFGDIHKIVVPYDEEFNRDTKHYSKIYFGCSIKALIDIMSKKDYYFLGTSSTGINAFFVKSIHKTIFEKIIIQKDYFPSIVREGLNKENELSFDNTSKNLEKIKDMEIVDLETNKIKSISELGEIYSENWKRELGESR